MAEIVPGFEPFEHTADAGIVARGRTLAETFEHAARGMYALMVDPDTVVERERVRVSASGESREDLLLAWLDELLLLTDTRGLLFRSFRVESVDGGSIAGEARGERVDRERHALGVGVKAITRHHLEVTAVPGGYCATVLFDI